MNQKKEKDGAAMLVRQETRSETEWGATRTGRDSCMQKRAKDSAPDTAPPKIAPLEIAPKTAVAPAPETRRAGGDKEEGGKHIHRVEDKGDVSTQHDA